MDPGSSVCDEAWARLSRHEVHPQSTLLRFESAKYYFPASVVEEVLQHPAENCTVKDLFSCGCQTCPQDADVDNLSDRYSTEDGYELLGKYAAVYGLLVYLRRPGLIHKFRQNGKTLDGTAMNFFKGNDLDFLSDVRHADVIQRQIIQEQYKFLVRKLEARNELTIISLEETLPIYEDRDHKGQGNFGTVYGFKFQDNGLQGDKFLDHEYRGDSLNNISRFAHKSFRPEDTKTAAKEWYKLQIVRQIRHEHLMPALGAFQRDDIFFILFEEASGTLGSYLKGEGTTFTTTELWKQVYGLAEGLASLHAMGSGSKIAYHKDLKPANILIVGNIMKISDFGLLEFKNVDVLEEDAQYDGYRPYAAPDEGRPYTHESDIWSIGAIISEIATFDIQKNIGVIEYRENRKKETDSGYTTGVMNFHRNNKVKDSVLKQHLVLETHVMESGTPQILEHLHPFQKHFFSGGLFPLVEKMLRHDRTAPSGPLDDSVLVPNADEVAKKLKELHADAEQRLKSGSMSNPGQLLPVWDEIQNGVLWETPTESYYIIRAETTDKRDKRVQCGLLLFTDDRHTFVTVQCHTNAFENGIPYRDRETETFLRRPEIPLDVVAVITPSYIQSEFEADGAFQVQIGQIGNRQFSYWLENIESALILQAAICGHYPFRSRTFTLDSWELIRPRSFGFHPKGGPILHQSCLQVQLWSYGPVLDENKIWKEEIWANPVPIIHIAVLSPTTIFLIRVKAVMQCFPLKNTLRFTDTEVSHIDRKGGIPISLKEGPINPQEYKEASLSFESQNDRETFQGHLGELNEIWQHKKRRHVTSRKAIG